MHRRGTRRDFLNGWLWPRLCSNSPPGPPVLLEAGRAIPRHPCRRLEYPSTHLAHRSSRIHVGSSNVKPSNPELSGTMQLDLSTGNI